METFKRLMVVNLLCFTGISGTSIAQQVSTPVFVAPVKQLEFVDEVEALGTLQAQENVELTSTVTELMTKVNFEDNQRVKKGDVLVEMDAAEELAEKAEEQSRVDEAQRQVNRLQPLVKKNSASESVLDAQQRELQTAKARMSAVQSRINQRLVVAPFDGVVGLRNISVGALVQPGTLITTIDDDRMMKLDFSVPEVFLATLKPGIPIQATSRAYQNEIFRGAITNIDSRVDPVTRSVVARALLDNTDQKLKAGMLMRVLLRKNSRQALVVPEEAVTVSGTQNYVMIAVQGADETIAQRQPVQIGARRKGEVEIIEGVKEGQYVIIHGALRLRPGAKITIKAIETNNESLTELLEQNNAPGNTQ